MPFSIQLLTKTPIVLQPSQSFGIEFFVNKTGVDPESVTITLRDHNNNILSTRRFDNVTQSFSMSIGNLTAPSKPGTYVFTLEAFNNTTNTLDDSKSITINVVSPIVGIVTHPLSVYKKKPKRLPLSMGFKRYALSFDGVDDYIVVPRNNLLDIQPGNIITIEILAFLTGWQPGYPVGVLIDKRTENLANYNWEFTVTAMHMRVHAAGTKYIVSVPHSLNRWNHYVMVLNGNVLQGYLNGVLKAQRTDVPTSQGNTTNLYIGCNFEGAYLTKGLIALVRIYNRALSVGEIRYNMLNYHNPIRSGLVLWLHDRIVGSNWLDESGNSNNGSVVGAIRRNLSMWELRAGVGL